MNVPAPFFVAILLAAAQAAAPQDVTDLDLEDLMKVRVSSPGKKAQTFDEVPAALFVIRGDDLRRRGVTSIAEALRGVPGFQVGRQDANTWTITARGFTSANKLLVLIDGRSVYSPLHSSVFWDAQNVFMEDVDRVEVVRGPGGTLWGSNAVNGVVNVIMKPADETQGGVLYGGGGFEERYFAGARYGAKAGEDHYIRVSANTFRRDDSVLAADPDEDNFDDLYMSRGGLRWDWKIGKGERLSFITGYYEGRAQERVNAIDFTVPANVSYRDRTALAGGHAVLRWERELAPDSSLSAQLYYDRSSRLAELFEETEDTVDAEIQHRFSPFEGHDVVWGVGYRLYKTHFRGGDFASTDPSERRDDIPSVFLQDEITLIEERLKLTAGAKAEHNDYSGFEIQPSVRLAWSPDEHQMIWLAASRAMRTPSILDNDFVFNAAVIPGAPPTLLRLEGTRDFRAEELLAFEAGYRAHPWDPLLVDVALFYNLYDDLRSIEAEAPASEPPFLVLPFRIENEATARTYGAELALNAQVMEGWHLRASYAYLYMNIDLSSESTDTTSELEEERSPRNQVWIRSAMDLSEDVDLDVMARYVSRLPGYPADAYVEIDVRLGWRIPGTGMEVAIVGQNLVHRHHEETSSDRTGSELERGGYASLTWRF